MIDPNGLRIKDPNRVATGRRSRTKGANNERALCKLFKAWWTDNDESSSIEFSRVPLSGGWGNRSSFNTHGDIICSDASFPFVLEAKQQEKWCLDQIIYNGSPIVLTWWQQALDQTPEDKIPLLIMGRNHTPRLIFFNSKFMDKLNCGFPWENQTHFVLSLKEERYIIMTLESFFKVNPDVFGRNKNNDSTPATTPSSTDLP